MRAYFIFIITFIMINGYAQNNPSIKLWTGEVPGEISNKLPIITAPSKDSSFKVIAEVTDPDIVVFKADKAKKSSMGVIICPGGGYSILVPDKEGSEIAEWFNSLGITSFVLHYRVPNKREGALQDLQRAIRIVRSRASEWNIDPEKIGILGFSAGGSLCARAATLFNQATYPVTDEYDNISCRPDFTILIYPAYLDNGPEKSLSPELKISKYTPPVFIYGTADDTYGNSCLVMASALRYAKIPVELHFLPSGGHGYGLRKGNYAGETWPGLLEKWLIHNIILK